MSNRRQFTLWALCTAAAPVGAQPPPSPSEGDWSAQDIQASRSSSADGAVDRPSAPTAPLLLALHAAGRQLALIDAQRWQLLAQWPSPRQLQGAPQISPDGRYAYWGASDGWIVQWDLWQRRAVAQVRSGQQLQALRLSADGRWLLAGQWQPQSLALLDAQLHLQRLYRTQTLDAKSKARVHSLHLAGQRQRFIAVLQDFEQLWEISTDPQDEPIFDGLVHDYKMGEGIAQPGYLGVRRTPLPAAFQHMLLAPGERIAIGAASALPGRSSKANLLVMQLDARTPMASLQLPGQPRPDRGCFWQRGGVSVFILPSEDGQHTSLLDTSRWQTTPQKSEAAALPQPLYEIRSAPDQSSLWARTRDQQWQVLDAQSLQLHAQVQASGPLSWSADGQLALLLTEGADGALLAFDARSGQPKQRLALPDIQAVYPLQITSKNQL